MKGFINNFDELNVIIKKHNPSIIALQETHCPFANNVPLLKHITLTFTTYPLMIVPNKASPYLLKKILHTKP